MSLEHEENLYDCRKVEKYPSCINKCFTSPTQLKKDYPENEKIDRPIGPFAGISLSEKHSGHR